MKKFYLLIALIILSCSKPNDKPNLLFILVDDLGWTDVSYNGSDFYETYNIDRLSLTVCCFLTYAASSVCSPTRASIMTGKHPAELI